MKTVTELAREAGLTLFQDSEGHCVGVTDEQLIAEARMHDDARLTRMLQRFHDLAIAQYRDSLLALFTHPAQSVNEQLRISELEAQRKQLLGALSRARETAMKYTLAARIPECGYFGEIAQDLDYVCAAIAAAEGKV